MPHYDSKALLSLALLILQNASIVLQVSYSKRVSSRPSYASSVVVACTEAIKGLVSLAFVAREAQNDAIKKEKQMGAAAAARRAVSLSLNDWQELVKMSVPAALYALQNNLNFYALANLPSPVYHVSYQARIIATALIGSIVFNKPLSYLKWMALALLFVGVAIVQLDLADGGIGDASQGGQQSRTLGFLAVAAACLTSGFAGAYFEYLLRGSPATRPRASLWVRNVQLAFSCLAFAHIAIYFDQTLDNKSPFHDFTWQVWLVVLNASVGGLLVAVVVRNSGAVAKGFATSLSIVLSTAANAWLEQKAPGGRFIAGGSLVLLATMLFSL